MAQQLNIFGEAEEPARAEPSAFSISQQIIDEVLTSGGNELDSTLRIAAYFKKDHMTAANADFLQKEYRRYGNSGKGFIFGGNHVSVWFDESGIRIAGGDTVLSDAATHVTWERAARRIRELLDMGRYMPQSELDKVDGHEIKALADSLWYTHQDLADGYEFSFLPEELFKGGFPDSTAQIAELLAQPEEREKILVGLQDFAAAYAQDNSLLRFRFAANHLRAALTGLEDLQLEPLAFTADESVSTARPGFITQDEVDRVLAGGSGVQDGHYRIYSYFLQAHTPKEKADFLKHEYGTGGGSRTGFDEWHDSKGIAYSRENNHMPYDKVILSWPKVARRIDELIADGRYMSEAQLAHLPEYEKDFLAGEVYSFFPRQPEDLSRPFPYGTDYSDGKKIIRPQLDQLERVAEILSQMSAILDNTADFDRNYEYMRKAFDDLTAYQNGTFSLFTPVKSAEQAQARPATPKQPPAPEPSAVPAAEYDLQLGASVYIGTDEYEIYSFDDAHVVLRDANAPLFTRDMPRAEFDRKLRENRLNDGLIKAAPKQKAPAETAETPRILYRKYLPILLDEIRNNEGLYDFLRDRDTDPLAAETEIRKELDSLAESIGEDDSAFYEAYNDLPQFREWLIEDMLDRTYQDVASGGNSLELHENNDDAPEWAKRPPLYEAIREELSLRGFAVSDELIAEWIEGYSSRYGMSDHEVVAEFIENEYLTEEPAPEPEPYTPKKGDRYEIQGRIFIVDSLNVDYDKVSLRDITFEGNVGFPIFRSESLDFIRMYDPIRPQQQPISQTGEQEQKKFITLEAVETELDRKVDLMLAYPDYEKIKEAARYWKTWRTITHRVGIAARVLVDQINALNDEQAIEWFQSIPWDNWREALDIGDFESLSLRETEPAPDPPQPSQPTEPETAAPKQDKEPISGLKSIVIDFTPHDREAEPVVNFPGEIVVEPVHIPRYTVKGIAYVDVISSNPQRFDIADKTHAYGVCDNHDGGRYLKNDDGTYVTFDSYAEAEAYAGELNAAEATLTPAWEKPKPRSRTQTFDPHPETPMSERHNFIITDDNLGHGGAKTKYRGNVEAIRTLQAVESENRFATPDEQEVLSRYVGWGSLANAFDESKPAWTNEYAQLKALLSPEEYESARSTTLNAHYTSPTVIKAIYKAIENMGFKTGNILDPGCGIGNFQGLLPDSMKDSRVFGVEIDPITGRIAQQLYQKNSIAIRGFEKTELPDSFFDLAIGNVPFGSYGVLDKRYDKHKFHIHDYFFAKTLDKVRPGGVIAFVTSRYTMDKKNSAVRKYIAQRADLLGAIRLPCNAFMANAGTEVTTDIIFLQKRDRIIDIEPDWVHLGETADGIPVNSYFAEHPDMILGTMSNDSGLRMYGAENSYSCVPFPDVDLSEQLADAITNIHAEITEYERGEDEPEEDNSVPADPRVRNFSYTLVYGQIYYRQDSRMVPVELPVTTQSRVKGMIALRECVRDLIMYQTEDYPDHAIRAEQAKLNRLYDSFTKKYGLINSRGNSIAFSQDSAYCLLCSLEVIDENGELERKADMFQKRTIKPHIEITHVDTASEALAVSMGEKARVDLPFMAALTGMSEDALVKELEGVIFRVPNSEMYVTADDYLSGNVREKLLIAQHAAENNLEYAVNVSALEVALPKDLTAAEISVRLGATWLPEDVVQRFMYELLQTSGYARDRIKVHYSTLDPTVDNMLKVTNDGRKLALDQRLINEMLPDDPDGKVAICANDVFRIWAETKEKKLAQLCFCDLSTPKNAIEITEKDGVFQMANFQNVYDDLRKKLVDKGVPAEEIAFIHEANTEVRKKELFAKVRKGQIRILLGSTQKMGAGTNVQDRLIALHDLDCPWRPSDLAQRLGRIVRQGNKNPEVEIFRYVTENTFDSYLYQLVENKQKFIAQIMTSKTPVRSAEDVDETALSYAEIKALATPKREDIVKDDKSKSSKGTQHKQPQNNRKKSKKSKAR